MSFRGQCDPDFDIRQSKSNWDRPGVDGCIERIAANRLRDHDESQSRGHLEPPLGLLRR